MISSNNALFLILTIGVLVFLSPGGTTKVSGDISHNFVVLS